MENREDVPSSSVDSVHVAEMTEKKSPNFKDLYGMEKTIEAMEVELTSFVHPVLMDKIGLPRRPITSFLLHGPPGCGKTKLANAIANEIGFPFFQKPATELILDVSGAHGSSQENMLKNIQTLFDEAKKKAPSVIFIDDLDAFASRTEPELHETLTRKLRFCMDEIEMERSGVSVLLIGATNFLEAVDPVLRRNGRFHPFLVNYPDESARMKILSSVPFKFTFESSVDLHRIARSTLGFSGADLETLAEKAHSLARMRVSKEMSSELNLKDTDWDCRKNPKLFEDLYMGAIIKMSDFEKAVIMVQPSLSFSSIPDVKWEDVGGLDHIRQEFEHYILWPIKFREEYEGFGVDLDIGFLLYGPPGCGKTLIVKALANEAGANFIYVKGPEVLTKYVGESEHAIRTLFSRARTFSPCILFFDEVDALTTKRGKEEGSVVQRVLGQLFVELDGADQQPGVFVIGATNCPEEMDPAVLRRFGKLLYVPLPNADQRILILKALARRKPVDASVDLSTIARMEACENLSGADLSALMSTAALAALEEQLIANEPTSGLSTINNRIIKTRHLELALSQVSPSVSTKQKRYYQRLSKRFKVA